MQYAPCLTPSVRKSNVNLHIVGFG